MDVCAAGVEAAAAQCAGHAERLASNVPTAVAGPPAQATAAAVVGAYTALGETAAVLVARLKATGDKLSVSAAEFASMDRTSAQALSALGGVQV
jgi:hypothetical protein